MNRIVRTSAMTFCLLALSALVWFRVRASQDIFSLAWDSGRGTDVAASTYLYGIDCKWSTYETQTWGQPWLGDEQPAWVEERPRFEFERNPIADSWEAYRGVQRWVERFDVPKIRVPSFLGIGFDRFEGRWRIRAPQMGGIPPAPELPERKGVTREWVIPYWLPIVILVIAPIRWLLRRIKTVRRARRGACVHCGYDLRASTGRCPECGSRTPPTARDFPSRPLVAPLAASILIAGAAASAVCGNHLSRRPYHDLPVAKGDYDFRPEFVDAPGHGIYRMTVTHAYGYPANWHQAIWRHDGEEFLVVLEQEFTGDALFSSSQIHVYVFDRSLHIVRQGEAADGTPYALFEMHCNDPAHGPGPWQLGIGIWTEDELAKVDRGQPVHARRNRSASPTAEDPAELPPVGQTIRIFGVHWKDAKPTAATQPDDDLDPFNESDVPIEIRSAEPSGPPP